MLSLVPLAIGCSLVAIGMDPPAERREALWRSIESRSAIHSGDVSLRVQVSGAGVSRTHHFRIVFDELTESRPWRSDTTHSGVRVSVAEKELQIRSADRQHVERVVCREDGYIRFIPDELEDGSTAAIEMGAASVKSEQLRAAMIDPRVLGLAVESFGHLPGVSLESVERQLRDAEELAGPEQDPPDQPETITAHFQIAAGVLETVVFSPQEEAGVTRATIERTGEGGVVRSSVESTLKQWGRSQIWFPDRVKFVRTVDDAVVLEEQVDVVAATFNEPIDPATFTLSGMDVPAGRAIIDDSGQNVIWDGERVAVLGSPPLEIPGSTGNRSRRFVISVSLAILALLLLIVSWFILRNRKPAVRR